MTTKRKPYVRPMTSTWWKKLPFYRFYMLREGTAVPAVWFSIELIFGLFALKHGAESWMGFVGFCKTRWWSSSTWLSWLQHCCIPKPGLSWRRKPPTSS